VVIFQLILGFGFRNLFSILFFTIWILGFLLAFFKVWVLRLFFRIQGLGLYAKH
jgi:hypothetical protein